MVSVIPIGGMWNIVKLKAMSKDNFWKITSHIKDMAPSPLQIECLLSLVLS